MNGNCTLAAVAFVICKTYLKGQCHNATLHKGTVSKIYNPNLLVKTQVQNLFVCKL